MLLCENCLAETEDIPLSRFPLGHDKGHQRDPYRVRIVLCGPCQVALTGGAESDHVDLAAFHQRWVERREVRRGS